MFQSAPIQNRSSDNALIELRNVSKRFVLRNERPRSVQEQFIRLLRPWRYRRLSAQEFWALRDVSLAVYAGESVGIIGPNGSGKSTLLKLLVGILEPTTGRVTVHGRVSSLLELGAGFHPDLTGRENVFLNGAMYGLSQQQIRQRMESIVDFAELGGFIDTPVKHYSSGMYVRLGFAVAVHTDPDLLLVDEVLAVGDAAFQHKCQDVIRRFRSHGGTLLLVSHDLATIQSQCDRALWLDWGRVGAQGHPTDVVMAYLNAVAAKEDAGAMILPQLATGRRWGSGKIELTRVELCDDGGTPRTIFVNQGYMEVRLHYHARGRVNTPIFGIGVHHQNGTHITGPNTKFANMYIPYVEGTGCISYKIPALPLLEGGYDISVAVIDDGDTEVFDYHDRAYPFRVYPGRSGERYGLVTLNGAWSAVSD